jgi:hypothetical protein
MKVRTTQYNRRKNIFVLVFLLLTTMILALMAGCSGEEDFNFPVEPSHQDAAVLLSTYAEDLVEPANGWEGTLVRRAGKVYRLHITFSNETVDMLADVDTISAIDPSTSVYTMLIKNGQPAIEFPVGSHLDRMQNPDDSDGVDKEYTIKGRTENEIFLQGNTFGDELILRVTSPDFELGFHEGSVKQSIKGVTGYLSTVRLLYFEPEPGKKIQFVVRSTLRSTYFTYIENERAGFFGSDYTYTSDGIELANTATIHGVDVHQLGFDKTMDKFYVMYNGSRLYAQESLTPVIPLHYLLGNEFLPGILLIAEWYEQQPGWSYKFREQWTLTDFDLDDDEFGLSLLFVNIDINPDNNTMKLTIYTLDLYGRVYRAEFPYEFTKTVDGIFDFEPLEIDSSTAAGQYAEEKKEELARMLDIVNNYTYSIDFYDFQGVLMPQYQSMEDIEMYFTGSFY